MQASVYRRIWRWHFYAGLVCLPFILSLAITGALYLFHQQIDDVVYGSTLLRPDSPATLPASLVVDAAVKAYPGQAIAITFPADNRHNGQVDVAQAAGVLQVFVDPASGKVAGAIREDARLMTTIKHIHSLAIVGTAGKVVIEIVAGWIIVLMATGTYLWWPRGRTAGVVAIRPGATGRIWWRDLHAVTGAFGGIVILFLALTGMPWSVVWGTNVNAWLTAHGLGVPAGMWAGVPKSDVPASALGTLPWAQQQDAVPASSNPHAMHEGMTMAPASFQAQGIDAVVAHAGILPGDRLALPRDAHGVFSVIHLPGQVEQQRVRHIDQYTGRVLMDIRGTDIGAVGRVTEWGVAVHQGLQYGWPNVFVMLAGCLALMCLCISGIVVWWKRRPAGTLAAPERRDDDHLATGVLAIAVVLGCLFPLLGASMLSVLLIDTLLCMKKM
ncbi:MAG: PepSY domain-containing protein [Pseudomonadota bacterium]|nr:PepSY domain-containing protein [Pseudomonadota bacterium]